MNSSTLGSGQSRFDFLRYLLPAIVLFVVIVVYGEQLVEMGGQLLRYENESEPDSDSGSESDSESGDQSVAGQLRRATRRSARRDV